MKETDTITLRQCCRSIFLESFGISIFLMTRLLLSYGKEEALGLYLTGSLLVLALTLFYVLASEKETTSYGAQLLQKGEKVGRALLLLTAARYVFRAAFVLVVFYRVLHDFLFPDRSFLFLAVPFLIVCSYGAGKGEVLRARTEEFLFWFVIVPFLLAVVLVLKDANVTELKDAVILSLSFSKIKGIAIPLSLYTNVELLLFFLPKVKQEERKKKPVFAAILSCFFLNGLLLIATLLVLGTKGTAGFDWPGLKVLESAKVPGGFLERLDSLIICFWMCSVFAVISGLLLCGASLVGMWKKRVEKEVPKGLIWLLCVVIFLLAYGMLRNEHAVAWYVRYSLFLDLPLSILTVLFVKFKKKAAKKSGRKMAVCLLLLVSLVSLSGCGAIHDVEQYDYVLTLGIDPGQQAAYRYTFAIATAKNTETKSVEADSLLEAVQNYEQSHSHKLQLGHVRALVLGASFYSDLSTLDQVLANCRREPQLALTTSLYGAENEAKKEMEQCPEKNLTLGEYLDDLVANQESKMDSKDNSLYRYYAKREKCMFVAVPLSDGMELKKVRVAE